MWTAGWSPFALRCIYSRRQYREATLQRLMDAYADELRAIAALVCA